MGPKRAYQPPRLCVSSSVYLVNRSDALVCCYTLDNELIETWKHPKGEPKFSRLGDITVWFNSKSELLIVAMRVVDCLNAFPPVNVLLMYAWEYVRMGYSC